MTVLNLCFKITLLYRMSTNLAFLLPTPPSHHLRFTVQTEFANITHNYGDLKYPTHPPYLHVLFVVYTGIQ